MCKHIRRKIEWVQYYMFKKNAEVELKGELLFIVLMHTILLFMPNSLELSVLK